MDQAKGIIALGHELNLEITAEGVENETQMDCLRMLNCDEIQGYLVSKSLPATGAVTFKQVYEEMWTA